MNLWPAVLTERIGKLWNISAEVQGDGSLRSLLPPECITERWHSDAPVF